MSDASGSAPSRKSPVHTENTCPLSRVRAGTCVRIKKLIASPDLCHRLRELGFTEEQQVRLLLQSRQVVCQVCNVRLGLSAQLADSIWVEPIKPAESAA
ncbi:MAG TPA: FeoA family protein [Verrucomicrobiota bacterium]|nr:FeoA family protein [Verrucomicrobiota bacterium]HNU51778.1 FeoA family protein [Verrucomicrobiota bacterium]